MLVIATIGPAWLYHPLGHCAHDATYTACRSYNFWSGIEGALPQIALAGAVLGALIAAARVYRQIRRALHHHLECHAEGCARIGLHRVEGTPHRVCWEHHPELGGHPDGHAHHQVPLDVIRARHGQRRRT